MDKKRHMNKINKNAIWPQGLPFRFFNNLMVFLVTYLIYFLKVYLDFPSTHTQKRGVIVCVEGD